jgi:hypothetical protein
MNIFCITSTINVTSAPWSYTATRSAWTSEERLDQTSKQIDSIRKYCKDSYIILSEGSILTREQYDILVPKVDVFLNDISDETVYNAIHTSKYKGLGEMYELLAGINHVIKTGLHYNLFFKLGGRISLNSRFNIENYNPNAYNFNVFNTSPRGYSTILFNIPYSKLCDFKEIVETLILRDIVSTQKGIEYIYPDYFRDIHTIDTMGVEGYMGITRHEFFTK